MKNEKMSILDAFIALKDLDDVNEAQLYSLRDSKQMNAARSFIDEDADTEVPLEVIDVNADTIEHLKDNKEYVGQFLLQCASCRDVKFVDHAELEEAEGNSELYNINDECPHCHALGTGYTLLGQVGAVTEEDVPEETEVTSEVEESEEEVKFTNDEKDETEATFTNEEEPEETTEGDSDETVESEETEERTVEDEETPYDETTSSEDDEEESTLGDVVDEDDVAYDDTEEAPEETEEDTEEETEETKEESKPKKKKMGDSEELEESLQPVEEDLVVTFTTVEDFLNHKFLSPETLRCIKAVDSATGKKLYDGSFEELPYDILKSFVYNFSTENGPLVIETCDAEDNCTCVKDLLADYCDHTNDNIHLCDAESSETFYSGDVDTICSDFGKLKVVKLENPEILVFFINNENNVEAKEEAVKSDEEKLVDEIVDANGLSKYKVTRPGTEENFIKDCICESEDLNLIYEKFVLPTANKNLIESFKAVTGYKDELDLVLEKQNVYKGNIKVVTEEKQDTNSFSVTTRKELSEKLLELKNNNQPYRVRRSVKEGYRYDVILLEKEEITDLVVAEPEAEVVDVEIVDRHEPEVETTTDNPLDRAIVDKLLRIAGDIKNAIETNYNIVVDERKVLADLIQDLRLISGQIKPEDLEDTPINQLTKQMYQGYSGFMDALDELVSFETGRPITHSEVRNISRAIQSLDDESFSTEAINAKIADPKFLQLVRAGQVPYFDRLQLDHVMREDFDETEEIDLEEVADNEDTFFEVIDALIKDEQEAIDGYVEAEVKIEDMPELDEKEKEEILDTIEHIKEEEIEHIEELEELVDTKEEQAENDPISEVEDQVADDEVAETLTEAWELDSAHITDEVKTTGRLVKGTFVVIGFKDAKEQTNFRSEYEYNLDTKKLKLKDVAFKFSPKHIKEIEAQLKADIDKYLDDEGNYNVNVSQPSDPDPVEPEVGESNETNHPLDEDTHAKYAKPEGNRTSAFNNALTYAKKENKPFIYGYTNHTGKFFALDQPIKIAEDPVSAERAFRDQYKNCTIVYIAYPDKAFVNESEEDFDEVSFDARVNRFFTESYGEDEVLLYRTIDGFIKEDNTIVLEGIIDTEELGSDHKISFTLTESEDKYLVSNSLSDETFLIEQALVKKPLNERSYSASGSGTVYITPTFEVEFEGFKIKGSADASAYVKAYGSGYYEPATYWEPAEGEFEIDDFEVEDVEVEGISSIDSVLDSEGNEVTDENFHHEKYETLDHMLESKEFLDAVSDKIYDSDVSEYIDEDDLDFDWEESEPDYD